MYLGGTLSNVRPAFSALLFVIVKKRPQATSLIARDRQAILDHPANVQIFDPDRVKSSDQMGRYLVMKILATTRDFQMRFGDFDSLLRAPLRPLLSARKSSLLSLQVVQRAIEMARIVDLFAVRECGETGYANIYANSLSGSRQGFRFGHLANNQSIPAVNTTRDPKLFALSFNLAGKPDSTSRHREL